MKTESAALGSNPIIEPREYPLGTLAVFDPQGVQTPVMGKEAYEASWEARLIFEAGSDATGIDMREYCYGDNAKELQGDLTYIQPAIVTATLADYAYWLSNNPEPEFFTGLSLGLFTAVGASGSIDSVYRTVQIAKERSRIMQEAADSGLVRGAMAVIIGLPQREVASIIGRAGAEFAIIRDSQLSITGEEESVLKAIEVAKQHKARLARMLPISVAAHSTLQEAAVEPMRQALEGITFSKSSRVKIIANDVLEDGTIVLRSADEIRDHLAEQMARAVNWPRVAKIAKTMVDTVYQFGPDTNRRFAREIHEFYDIRAPQLA